MKTMTRFHQDDLPFIQELEELVISIMDEISTWDITVFRNVYDKVVNFKNVNIEVKHNNFYLTKQFILTRPGSKPVKRNLSFGHLIGAENVHDEWVDSIYSYTKELIPDIEKKYYLSITLDENGNLNAYSINSSSNVPLHSVTIGDKKMLINSETWYNRENFAAESFQYSVSEPKSPFDLVFVNNIILRFGVGV
ncbi:hypothetical protein K0M00_004341 [Escherichia coli]|uniref:Uncharacterized protein n=1 Tax=Escherichia phage SP27 TaxID=2495557 RepID=A0A5A4U5B5_9CAUD|nr:hypothetical protein [Escherichia coli]MED6536578.1 hypothetical protein [Escherichia coli O157]BBM61660.1 hypothetical protein EO157G_0710 [Escherichia phage SP27]EFF2105828.1 hypothetical protein [Escherichia coli]EHV4443254.1 hypothetical protein [Escherichia coli]EKR8628256.1 hypothetical protein [Escherichia coli]